MPDDAPARVLVLPPFFTIGAKLDFRMLGFQYWIADQLTAIGLEGASGLFRRSDEGAAPDARPQLVTSQPPTDTELRETLIANESRYGVVSTFAVLGERPYLATVRLVEVRRGHPLRALQRWKFDGDTDALPAAAHAVVVQIATRLGFVLAPSTWQKLFDTSDPILASNHFTALGCYSACDEGFAIDAPEAALRAALSGIAAGMRPAQGLFPHLVEALERSGSAPPEMLRDAVSAASSACAVVPEAWAAMIERLGVESRGLIN